MERRVQSITKNFGRYNLFQPGTIGEFAFSMWAVGMLWIIPAGLLSGLIFAWLATQKLYTAPRWVSLTAWVGTWLLCQMPATRRLCRWAKTWPAIVRQDRQLIYMELCMFGVLVVLQIVNHGETAPEILETTHMISVFFSYTTLMLVAYHVTAYAVLRVRVGQRELITWGLTCLPAVMSL